MEIGSNYTGKTYVGSSYENTKSKKTTKFDERTKTDQELVNKSNLVSKLMGTKTNDMLGELIGARFDRSENIDAGLYDSTGSKSGKVSASTMINLIETQIKNGDGAFSYTMHEDGDHFTLQGTNKSCSVSEIEKYFGYNSPKEIKVEDNTIIFENGNYYKFTDESGNEHKLLCWNDRLMMGFDYNQDDEKAWEFGNYWNGIVEGNSGSSMTLSTKYIKSVLDGFGIEEKSFFNLQIGNKTSTQYYTSNEYADPVQSKSQYDLNYAYKTSERYVNNREKNSDGTIRLAGKDYEINEKGTLDVEYGVDLYIR